MPPIRRPSRRAFTLVEAIATMTILATLGAVASNMILTAATSWRDAAATAQLHDELSTAMERIAKDLRAIGRDTAAPGVAPLIDSLTPTSISYAGGSTLALSGGRLLHSDGSATSAAALLADVSSLRFRAFDDSGEPLAASLNGAACRAIRRIEVEISLERHGVSHTLRTRVFLRSTMSGVSP